MTSRVMAVRVVLLTLGLALFACSEGGSGPTSDGPVAETAAGTDGGMDTRPAGTETGVDLRRRELGTDAPLSDGPRPDKPRTDGPAAEGPPGPDKALSPDKAPVPDKAAEGLLPDSATPSCTPFAGDIGKACTSSATCGTGMTCLLISATSGVCTQSCTQDDPLTSIVEDNCPAYPKNQCAAVPLSSGATAYYCVRVCKPIIGCSECDSGIACHPQSGSVLGLQGKAVCMYPKCTQGSDCPVTTGQTCNTTLSNCPLGETCITIATGFTDGICAKAGVCDLASGLCGTHSLGKATAKVGAPCDGDVHCAGNMTCLIEIDESKYYKPAGASCLTSSECCSNDCTGGSCVSGPPCRVRFRNGYCTVQYCNFSSTLTKAACPSGSECNHLFYTGFCQKSCSLSTAADCRNNPGDYLGDYECRAWNKIGSGIYTNAPVCDFGDTVPCSWLQGTAYSCSDLGDATNSTNMTCRNLLDNILPDPYSTSGLCLDNTPSGPVKPYQDAGVVTPDAGPPDGMGPLGQLGDLCSASAPCDSGLICIVLSSTSSQGFCSEICPTAGSPCTGGSPGTMPLCALSDGQVPPTYYCAFICLLSGQPYACPSGLTCTPTGTPGFSICAP